MPRIDATAPHRAWIERRKPLEVYVRHALLSTPMLVITGLPIHCGFTYTDLNFYCGLGVAASALHRIQKHGVEGLKGPLTAPAYVPNKWPQRFGTTWHETHRPEIDTRSRLSVGWLRRSCS